MRVDVADLESFHLFMTNKSAATCDMKSRHGESLPERERERGKEKERKGDARMRVDGPHPSDSRVSHEARNRTQMKCHFFLTYIS